MGESFHPRKSTVKFTDLSNKGAKLSSRSRYSLFVRIVIPLIIVSVVGGTIWLFKEKINDNLIGDTKGERSVDVVKTEYFVAQTSIKNKINNVSLKNISETEIATMESLRDKVISLTGVESEEVLLIEGEQVYDWVVENEYSGIVIVPVLVADFRLKTLTVDNIQLWDPDTNLQDYNLKYEEELSLAVEELETFSESDFVQENVFTYVAGGEVIPARAVARKFRRIGDYTFPFHKVKDIFLDSDISSVLLENAIAGSPEPCYGCVWFIGDEAFIDGLEYIDVDYVAFSGNHVGDGGINGIKRTNEVLDEAGIAHTGASGTSQSDASKPAFVEVNGQKIGFLSYDDVAYYHWAGDSYGGVAKFSDRDGNGVKTLLADKVQDDVAKAKKEADIVVVVLSWGAREYINWPLEYQTEAAHAFIDAGVDVIIGTHQHWVGAIEFYNGKPIFYGLGNFVFDQTHTDPTRQSALLRLYFYETELKHFDIIPIQSCGPQQNVVDDENCNHFQPQVLKENDPVYRDILDRMFEYSEI